jgi:hypothetical protein
MATQAPPQGPPPAPLHPSLPPKPINAPTVNPAPFATRQPANTNIAQNQAQVKSLENRISKLKQSLGTKPPPSKEQQIQVCNQLIQLYEQ